MLTHYGEPPAWDAFSKVNLKNIDPSEYEDPEDEFSRKPKPALKEDSQALVKAKPTSINGWDPETRTQRILTDEEMQSE